MVTGLFFSLGLETQGADIVDKFVLPEAIKPSRATNPSVVRFVSVNVVPTHRPYFNRKPIV